MGSLAAVALGGQIAGTALGTVGQIQQTNTEDAVAKQNAEVADQQAVAARRAAAWQAAQIAAKRDSVLAKGRVAAATSGISGDVGSAAEVQRKSAEDALQDELMAIYRGDTASSQAESEAANIRALRPVNKQAGYLAAGTTLLQGGSYAASNYARLR